MEVDEIKWTMGAAFCFKEEEDVNTCGKSRDGIKGVGISGFVLRVQLF